MTALMDPTIRVLQRKLVSETERSLALTMRFPTSWDLYFRETMSSSTSTTTALNISIITESSQRCRLENRADHPVAIAGSVLGVGLLFRHSRRNVRPSRTVSNRSS
jgi:hypothetical protein